MVLSVQSDNFDNWPSAIHPSMIATDAAHRGSSVLTILGRLGMPFNFSDGALIVSALDLDVSLFPAIRYVHIDGLDLPSEKYDFISLYDAIDHLPDVDAIHELISAVSSMLNIGGVLHLRCHPYYSRCGTHLFDINKAYWHLYNNEPPGIWTLRFDDPMFVYKGLFRDRGLDVISELPNYVYPEPFFTGLMSRYRCVDLQMVDFVLRKHYWMM